MLEVSRREQKHKAIAIEYNVKCGLSGKFSRVHEVVDSGSVSELLADESVQKAYFDG